MKQRLGAEDQIKKVLGVGVLATVLVMLSGLGTKLLMKISSISHLNTEGLEQKLLTAATRLALSLVDTAPPQADELKPSMIA